MAIVTYDDIRNSIITWIGDISGLTTILGSFSEIARPAAPYAVLIITSDSTSTMQNVTLSTDGLTETIDRLDKLRVTINIKNFKCLSSKNIKKNRDRKLLQKHFHPLLYGL